MAENLNLYTGSQYKERKQKVKTDVSTAKKEKTGSDLKTELANIRLGVNTLFTEKRITEKQRDKLYEIIDKAEDKEKKGHPRLARLGCNIKFLFMGIPIIVIVGGAFLGLRSGEKDQQAEKNTTPIYLQDPLGETTLDQEDYYIPPVPEVTPPPIEYSLPVTDITINGTHYRMFYSDEAGNFTIRNLDTSSGRLIDLSEKPLSYSVNPEDGTITFVFRSGSMAYQLEGE